MITGGRTIISEGCPARCGDGVNLSTAEFTLHTDIAGADTIGVSGTFRATDESAHPGDYIETGIAEVTLDSLEAGEVAQVATSPAAIAEVGKAVLAGAASCDCRDLDACPFGDEFLLLSAIRRAALQRPE